MKFLVSLFILISSVSAGAVERCINEFIQPYETVEVVRNEIQRLYAMKYMINSETNTEARQELIRREEVARLEFFNRFKLTLENQGVGFTETRYTPDGSVAFQLTGTGRTQLDRVAVSTKRNYGIDLLISPMAILMGADALFSGTSQQMYLSIYELVNANSPLGDGARHEAIHMRFNRARVMERGSGFTDPIHLRFMQIDPQQQTQSPFSYDRGFALEEMITFAYNIQESARAGNRAEVESYNRIFSRLSRSAIEVLSAALTGTNLERIGHLMPGGGGTQWIPIGIEMADGRKIMLMVFLSRSEQALIFSGAREDAYANMRRLLTDRISRARAFAQLNVTLSQVIEQNIAGGDIATAMQQARQIRQAQQGFIDRQNQN